MPWTLTDELDAYTAKIGPLLLAQPVLYTLQLSLLDTLKISGATTYGEQAPRFGWWESSPGEVTAGFMVTPPYPVILTLMSPEETQALPSALLADEVPVSGVNAEQELAGRFAVEWTTITGATSEVFRRTRLFQLGDLIPPDPVPPGAARLGTARDVEIMESWFDAFATEVGEPHRRGVVEDRLSHDGLMLWEASGQIVSLAALTRPVAGVTRIGPVYTPPNQRRKGYAAAVTAALSQAALDQGLNHVALYTDLANPTSNSVYHRIGYRPIQDTIVLRFMH
jgi:GNAT superfamily N-acetyltransferase